MTDITKLDLEEVLDILTIDSEDEGNWTPLEDIAANLDRSNTWAKRVLTALVKTGEVEMEKEDSTLYYRLWQI